MKTCSKCGKEKSIKEFRLRKKGKKIRHSWCRDCCVKYDKERYNNGMMTYNIKKWKEENRKINRINIINYFKIHPCVDCGETDPIVLEFDHKKDKKFSISNKIISFCWKSLLKEIEKCEVRCANCHRRKTHEQFNYHSYIK